VNLNTSSNAGGKLAFALAQRLHWISIVSLFPSVGICGHSFGGSLSHITADTTACEIGSDDHEEGPDGTNLLFIGLPFLLVCL
jgi:uncharacterized membrane protein